MSGIDPIYKELAAKIQGADTELIPRILARLANAEQARILKALPDRGREASSGRSLKVTEEFARKLGLDKETVDKHIQELFEKGVVFPTKSGPQMARNWMQLHDSTLGNPKYDGSVGNEFFDMWAESAAKSRPRLAAHIHPEAANMRVVPKWKSIKDMPGVLPYEDIRQILKSQELLVSLPCCCKRSYRERECGIPEESCINVGRTAQYNLDRGVGKKITYEEALAILEKYDNYPTISMVINQRDVSQMICNCHTCCCLAFIEEAVAKSRFLATVAAEDCKACGICVGKCQFGANQLRHDPELKAERAYTDPEVCRGCGDCVISCPNGARRMEIVRPPEHIPASLTIY